MYDALVWSVPLGSLSLFNQTQIIISALQKQSSKSSQPDLAHMPGISVAQAYSELLNEL